MVRRKWSLASTIWKIIAEHILKSAKMTLFLVTARSLADQFPRTIPRKVSTFRGMVRGK